MGTYIFVENKHIKGIVMKKTLAFLDVVALLFSACQKKDTASTTQNISVNGVSLSSPMKVDKENKTITVLAAVNGKYLTENTRHAVVLKMASLGTNLFLEPFKIKMTFFKQCLRLVALQAII